MFDFSYYSAKSKYYDDSNALIVGKIKDEIGDVAIAEFVGLKPNLYSILMSNSRKCKNPIWGNKNIVPEISHNECKDVLQN